MSSITNENGHRADARLDLSGHECPVPATETRRRLDSMQAGQVLQVIATDSLAAVDLQILCDRCGHELLDSRVSGQHEAGEQISFWIRVNPGRRPGAG